MSITNFKQIIQDLSGIAYYHPQINSFGFGDVTQITMDVETKQEPEYPKMYVIPDTVLLNQNALQYNFSIIILDQVNADLSNQSDVMSDNLEIVKDVFTILYQSYTESFGGFTNYYEPLWSPPATPFLERFETILGGWTLNVTLEQPFDYNTCVLPITGLTLPASVNLVNYKQILSDLEQIANHHEQINSYGYGDVEQLTNDIVTEQEPDYPRMYTVPANVTLAQNELVYNFQIIVADQLNSDLSNQRDVMNDTLEIVKDIFTVLYLSEYESVWGANVIPFLENYETTLAGWTLNLQITQGFDYNKCVLPITGLTMPTSVNLVNYKQILSDLAQIAEHHQQVNSYGFGDIEQLTNDIVTEQEPEYPRMYTIPADAVLAQNEMIYNFQIIVSDIINADLSNQSDVMSDTLEIIKDIFTVLYLSQYQSVWGASVNPFLESYETTLGGWVLNLQITQAFDYNRCDLPELPFVTANKKWYELAELWNEISKKWSKV